MTDTEIVEKAKTVLVKSPYSDLRKIKPRMESGKLFLSGIVNSFFHKQLAFQCLHSELAGIQIVTKDIEVKDFS